MDYLEEIVLFVVIVTSVQTVVLDWTAKNVFIVTMSVYNYLGFFYHENQKHTNTDLNWDLKEFNFFN